MRFWCFGGDAEPAASSSAAPVSEKAHHQKVTAQTPPCSAPASPRPSRLSNRGDPGIGKGSMDPEKGSLGWLQAPSSPTISSVARTPLGSLDLQAKVGIRTPKELFSDLTYLIFLGAGAYGSVYEGVWHGARVAIKFIKSDSLDSASDSVREASLSNMLAHPHVVQTFWTRSTQLDQPFIDTALREHAQLRTATRAGPHFASGEGFGDPYDGKDCDEKRVTTYGILHALGAKDGDFVTAISMEYCDNTSLHAVVGLGMFQPNAKWGPRIVLRALSRSAREVARGMWHLHCSGVIHGDLKPANVLLKHSRADRRGFVCKVSDFGLSHVCHGPEGVVAAETWSTLSYMAPEHFEGKLCQASDVYAFGVMLQEMYTGIRPFQEYSFGEVMQGVISGRLRPQWPPGSPPALAALSLHCMAQKPADRPTFDVIIEDLNSMEDAMRTEEFTRRNLAGSMDGTNTLLSSGFSASNSSLFSGNGGDSNSPPPHIAATLRGPNTKALMLTHTTSGRSNASAVGGGGSERMTKAFSLTGPGGSGMSFLYPDTIVRRSE